MRLCNETLYKELYNYIIRPLTLTLTIRNQLNWDGSTLKFQLNTNTDNYVVCMNSARRKNLFAIHFCQAQCVLEWNCVICNFIYRYILNSSLPIYDNDRFFFIPIELNSFSFVSFQFIYFKIGRLNKQIVDVLRSMGHTWISLVFLFLYHHVTETYRIAFISLSNQGQEKTFASADFFLVFGLPRVNLVFFFGVILMLLLSSSAAAAVAVVVAVL